MMELTQDRFLGGKLVARQPAHGFRSGLDAVMVAAAVPARRGDEVLELGCGAAVAGLCLAARVEGCKIIGIDRDVSLVSLAQDNARLNGMERRLAVVAGDTLSLPRNLRRSYDHVFCNPPFYDGSGRRSPNAARAAALHDEGQLNGWIINGLKRVSGKGSFTLIVRTDRLGEVLAHATPYSVTIFPLWASEGKPASRVIVQVRKNSRAPLCLLPGLVLHEADGRYTPEADAILRKAGSLALAGRNL